MSSRLVISSITICLGSLATYYTFTPSSTTFPYGRALLLSALLYIPFQAFWKFYLWPFYFSPLRKLPQAPYRFRWKTFLTEMNAEKVLELVDTVPNEGVFRYLDQLNSEVVHITSTKAIQEAFQQKGDDFEKPPEFRSILAFTLGNGLIASEGHEHKLQRKYLAPAFTSRVVRNLYGLFWAKSCEAVSLMKNEIETSSTSSSNRSAVINIDNWTGRVSLDIIAQAGIGQDFESLSKPDSPLIKSYLDGYFPDSNSKWIYILLALTNPLLVSMIPLEGKRKIGSGIAAVTAFLQDMMDKRQAEMHASKGGVGDETFLEKSGQKDIISHAMNSGIFSTASLVDQAKTLLGAGHDTSTTSLTWGIHFLSEPKNYHIQQRLREEIRANLPSPSTGVEADPDTLDKLPYLDAVCKEILRLRPPVPAVRRNAIRDTEVCGYRIPKGARVGCGFWAINQAKVLWGEDAREFKPERWLEGDNKAFGGADNRTAFMTFGWGRRACVGKGFAMGENKALMATLIGSFDFKPVGGRHSDTEILWGVTARIAGGVDVEATILDGW